MIKINKKFEILIPLNKNLINFFREYIESHKNYEKVIGIDFLNKINKGIILDEEELYFIEYIHNNYSKKSHILDFKPGFGQISIALKKLGFNNIEICNNNNKEYALIKELISTFNFNIKVYNLDYRDHDLEKYDLVFSFNAKSSHYGVNDYYFISELINKNKDVILMNGRYGIDNLIFEKLDSDVRISREQSKILMSEKFIINRYFKYNIKIAIITFLNRLKNRLSNLKKFIYLTGKLRYIRSFSFKRKISKELSNLNQAVIHQLERKINYSRLFIFFNIFIYKYFRTNLLKNNFLYKKFLGKIIFRNKFYKNYIKFFEYIPNKPYSLTLQDWLFYFESNFNLTYEELHIINLFKKSFSCKLNNPQLFIAYKIACDFKFLESREFIKEKIKSNDFKSREYIYTTLIKYYLNKPDCEISLLSELFVESQDIIDQSNKLRELYSVFHEKFILLNSLYKGINIYDILSMDKNFTNFSWFFNFLVTERKIKNIDFVENKLLFCANSFDAGGAEIQALNFIKVLNKYSKMKISVFVRRLTKEASNYKSIIEKNNIEISTFLGRKFVKDSFFSFIQSFYFKQINKEAFLKLVDTSFLSEIEKFTFQIQKEKPSILVTWADDINIFGGIAACITGIPKVIMNVRSLAPDLKVKGRRRALANWPLRYIYKDIYKSLIQEKGYILCANSKAVAHSYSEWLQIPVDKIQIKYNLVDFNYLDQNINQETIQKNLNKICIKNTDKIIGGVFRLRHEKRPFLWIEVAEIVVKKIPNVKFILLGDGILFNDLKKTIFKNKLSKNIFLIGQVNDVASWIDRFELVLHTSMIEGLPNALAEAQGLGVPVISTNCGGASETFIDNITGLKVDDSKPDILAEELIKLLNNKDWLKNASFEAKKFSRERFGMNTNYKSHLEGIIN